MNKVSLVTAISLAAFVTESRAVVTPADYYRLGEADAGAVSGGPVITSADSSGNGSGANGLSAVGTPTYTSNVSAVAAARTGSTLAVDIGGAGNYLQAGAVATSATDNFGVEGWFNPDSSGQAALAYTGSTGGPGGGGFGLFVFGGTYQGLYGNVALLDSGVAVTPGAWTYFALVRDGGTTSLYIDSTTARPTTFGTAPAVTSVFSTTIGANQVAGDAYAGLADEIRFFTFAPGAFNASTDLLIAVPEPASLGLVGLAMIGLAARRNRRA